MDRGACPRGHKEMDVTEHKLLSLKLCFFFIFILRPYGILKRFHQMLFCGMEE